MNGFTKINGNNGIHHESDFERYKATAEYLKKKTNYRPKLAIICGTGLGLLAENVKDADIFDYKEIPNFPVSTVSGHKGRLIFGLLSGKCVLCMQGRVHGYEGYSQKKMTFPVNVMKELGIEILFMTNAAGGLNPDYKVGDVMIMKDHLNLPGMCGVNPLVGVNDERLGPRFPALSRTYDRELRELAKKKASELGFDDFIREGVYSYQVGPPYETIAECRMLLKMGVDVTGMSTVPEATVAVHRGIRAFAMSLVTNECVMDYDDDREANHEEVLETAAMRAKDMQKLVISMIEQLQI